MCVCGCVFGFVVASKIACTLFVCSFETDKPSVLSDQAFLIECCLSAGRKHYFFFCYTLYHNVIKTNDVYSLVFDAFIFSFFGFLFLLFLFYLFLHFRFGLLSISLCLSFSSSVSKSLSLLVKWKKKNQFLLSLIWLHLCFWSHSINYLKVQFEMLYLAQPTQLSKHTYFKKKDLMEKTVEFFSSFWVKSCIFFLQKKCSVNKVNTDDVERWGDGKRWIEIEKISKDRMKRKIKRQRLVWLLLCC